MEDNLPLVSIIIPYYNSAIFLERTIQSILSQEFTNWELILVDDGSKDNSSQIIQKFIETDNRIKNHVRPDSYKAGGRGAKNYGFTRSKGGFIVFFDSDDYMLDDYLSVRINILLQNANMDAVFSDFGWKVSDNLIPKKIYKYNENFNIQFNELRFKEVFWKSFLDLQFFWVPSNIMWRKSAISDIQWDESTTIGEDFEFNTRAILNGLHFYHTNTVNWYYMRNENSMISTSENTQQLEKRSLYFYLVGKHLISNKDIEHNNHLLVYIIKHQYRIIRRICFLNASLNSKKIALNSVQERIKELINLINDERLYRIEKRQFNKLKYIQLVALATRKGHSLFEHYLIGIRTSTVVLPSEFYRVE